MHDGGGCDQVEGHARLHVPVVEAARQPEVDHRLHRDEQQVAGLAQRHHRIEGIAQRRSRQQHDHGHEIQHEPQRRQYPEQRAKRCEAAGLCAHLGRRAVCKIELDVALRHRARELLLQSAMALAFGVVDQPSRRALQGQRVERGHRHVAAAHAEQGATAQCAQARFG